MRTPVLAALAALILAAGPAGAAEAPEPPAHDWSFSGPFGTFERDALRRGFQVYNEVCASCHGLARLTYRNLADIGFSGAEIADVASAFEVEDGPNDDGDMFFRPARASDPFVSPFANERAARASNGISVINGLITISIAKTGAAGTTSGT